MSLFVLSSKVIIIVIMMRIMIMMIKDGWVDIMYHGLDAVGIDQQVSW